MRQRVHFVVEKKQKKKKKMRLQIEIDIIFNNKLSQMLCVETSKITAKIRIQLFMNYTKTNQL